MTINGGSRWGVLPVSESTTDHNLSMGHKTPVTTNKLVDNVFRFVIGLCEILQYILPWHVKAVRRVSNAGYRYILLSIKWALYWIQCWHITPIPGSCGLWDSMWWPSRDRVSMVIKCLFKTCFSSLWVRNRYKKWLRRFVVIKPWYRDEVLPAR